jgi:molybdate transport system substrate-binding protein
MLRHLMVITSIVVPVSTYGDVAHAAEIKVLSAVVMKSALDSLAQAFERSEGHKVTMAYAPAGAIRDRIQGGEAFDLTVLPRPIISNLATQAKVAPDSVAVLARSAVSVCARSGASKPDISTVEAVKRSLLAAKSIAYSDPAKGGASGIHFARVLDRLGISEEIKPRTKLSGPDSAEYVARGEAELCVTQTMEILRTPGVVVVGQLPAELQNTTDFVFSAATAANAKEQAAAQAFLKYLQTPEARQVLKQMGMEPGGA